MTTEPDQGDVEDDFGTVEVGLGPGDRFVGLERKGFLGTLWRANAGFAKHGDLICIDSRPGSYNLLWATEGSETLHGVRVRIDAGRTTRVTCRQFPEMKPPDGLGRLVVFVERRGDTERAERITIERGRDEQIFVDLDLGVAWAYLTPGDCRVEVHADRLLAKAPLTKIVAGKETRLVVEYGARSR